MSDDSGNLAFEALLHLGTRLAQLIIAVVCLLLIAAFLLGRWMS